MASSNPHYYVEFIDGSIEHFNGQCNYYETSSKNPALLQFYKGATVLQIISLYAIKRILVKHKDEQRTSLFTGSKVQSLNSFDIE